MDIIDLALEMSAFELRDVIQELEHLANYKDDVDEIELSISSLQHEIDYINDLLTEEVAVFQREKFNSKIAELEDDISDLYSEMESL